MSNTKTPLQEQTKIAEQIYAEMGEGCGFNGTKEDAIKIINGYLNEFAKSEPSPPSPDLETLLDEHFPEIPKEHKIQVGRSEITKSRNIAVIFYLAGQSSIKREQPTDEEKVDITPIDFLKWIAESQYVSYPYENGYYFYKSGVRYEYENLYNLCLKSINHGK